MSLEIKHLMDKPLTTYSPTWEMLARDNNWTSHFYVCYSVGE